MLGILSLNGGRLELGGVGLEVKIRGIFDLGDGLLDVGGAIVRLGLDSFTHSCWCGLR